MMTREQAFEKRNLTESQIDDVYEEWILEQEELHNAQERKIKVNGKTTSGSH